MEQKFITPSDVDSVKGNADFGSADPYYLVKGSVLKIAAGYTPGNTLVCMMQELGLLTKDRKRLTKKGKAHLWEWYHRDEYR